MDGGDADVGGCCGVGGEMLGGAGDGGGGFRVGGEVAGALEVAHNHGGGSGFVACGREDLEKFGEGLFF